MVVAVQDIRAAFWQPRLSHLGEIVEDVEDIHQCLTIILTTQKGSDCLRPDFALDLMAYVDRPISDVHSQIVSDIIQAISIWEQRCQILRVDAAVEAPSGLVLTVVWRPVSALNDGAHVLQTTVELAAVTGTAPDAAAGFVSIPFQASLTLGTVDGGTL